MANIYSAGTGPHIALSDVLSTMAAGGGIGVVASNTTFTSGTISISGFGAATVNTTTNLIRISVPVQTTQPTLAIIASNATSTAGTVVISGFGAATVNTAAGTIRISVPTQTTQVETQTFVGGIAVNALTTYTSGTVVLSAGANITLGTNAQTVTISGVAAQTVQTQNMVAVSASDRLFSSGTVVITGTGGGITVNTSAGTIGLSVAAPVAQTVQTQNMVAIAVNAATTYTSGTVVFSNSNGITFGTNGQTVTASVPLSATMNSYYYNTAALYSIVASGQTNASASVIFMQIPQDVSFTRVDIPVSFQTASSAVNATAAVAFSNVAVLYSRNGISLNPIVGASNTITVSWVSNTGIASSATGARLLSFGLASTISPGMYWLGLHVSTTSAISTGTATTALNGTLSMLLGGGVASVTATLLGDFNAATNASVNVLWPLQGLISSAITATSQTLQQSQITQSGVGLVRANPIVIFRN